MFPRDKFSVFCGILFLMSIGIFPASIHANPLISFYQKHISVTDGNRCPMKPSCAEYAKQAMEKHGPVLGWIMTCDRLLRCGRSQKRIGPYVDTKDGVKIFDPVEDNDSWWFSSSQKHP